jgi:hypothetical protein
MQIFKWSNGRQGGGYAKMPLIPSWLGNLFMFDFWILRIPSGTCIQKHTDPLSLSLNHHRLNFTLKRPHNKARMYVLGPVKRWWRFELFRPDLHEHGLEPVDGDMYLLSLGWATRKK